MTALNVLFDFAGNMISDNVEVLPTTNFGPRSAPQQTYTTGAGGVYQLRPELSRPGLQIVASRAGMFIAPVALSVIIADAMVSDYEAVTMRSPEHHRQGMWHTYSQMLTGTGFGIGSGLNL